MSVDVLDLTCPKCGGTMEPDRAKGSLHCPYCDYEQLLTPSDEETAEAKAYARQKGILQANAEAEKTKKRSKLKKRLIIVGVIVAFFAAAFIYNEMQPKINPFDYITVEFTGNTGAGSAEVVYLENSDSEVDPQNISYTVSPRDYLSEGDRVTVTASSSTYVLSETSKIYTVEGLGTYLTELDSLSEKAVTMIHNKSDILVERVTGCAFTKPKSVTPCKMYLTTDGKTNMFYDVYRIIFPDGEDTESERFAVVYYKNVIVHDTEEPTMSFDSSMYYGQIIETCDNTYEGYITGYKTLKDAKADILSHQSTAVTLKERDS